MPWTYESSKDGLIVTGIPDSLTVDSPEFDQILADRRAQRDAQSAPQASEPSVLDRIGDVALDVGAGIMRGIAPMASGAAIGAAAGTPGGLPGMGVGALAGAATMTGATMLGDPLANVINAVAGRELVIPPTEAINSILDQVGMPHPNTAIGRVAQGAAAGAGSAAGFVGAGKALQRAASPMVQKVGAYLAAYPAAQVAGGVGSGIGAQLAAEAGGGMLPQLAGGLIGGVTGAGLQSLASPRAMPRSALESPDITARAAAIKGADQNRIPVTTSDIVQNPTFASKWLTNLGEQLPIVGTGGLRANQQASRVQAVKNLAQEYGASGRHMDELAPVAQSFAAKRSADLSKYSTMKSEITDRLSPVGAVPVGRTLDEIEKQITSLSALKLDELTPVVARLEGWHRAIQGQDIKSMEIIRKQIGESFSDPSLAGVRGYGEKVLSAIYSPLREDLRDFVKTNGSAKDATKWEVANARLSRMAGDLDKDALRYILKKAESDPEAVGSLLFSNKPSDVQALFKGLPPKGRALAQRAIISKAVNAAGGLDALTTLSPDKFANEVARLATSTGVAFGGADAQRLTGLVRALEITKRAAQAGQAPPTGIQNKVPLVAGALASLLGEGTAAVSTMIGFGALARLYESKAVRDAAIALSRSKRGSRNETDAFRQIAMVITAADYEANNAKEKKK